MRMSSLPFSLPRKLEPDLARVLAYWEGLKRGNANMPFWDDVNLTAIPDLSGRLMLIEIFDKPVRFRIGMMGKELEERYGGDLATKFLDDIDARYPLTFLASQSSATVESLAPTYYHNDLSKVSKAGTREGYSRLLLPMWGDGRIGMLLGAVVWG